MTRLRHALLPLLALALAGCPTDPGTADDDDDAADDDDATELPVIPDPGTETDDWGFELFAEEDVCCGTPETAYPVGTVTRDAGYIQGVIDESLSFFYVFRTDATLETFAFPDQFEDVHLHEGDGLRFGELIDPVEEANFVKRWDVQSDHVYVLEIVSAFTGFF